MGDYSEGFKLCLCENEKIQLRQQELYKKVKGELVRISKKQNKNIPLLYTWSLSNYLGKIDSDEMGSFLFPSSDIGEGLNAEWILLHLNCENCFNFDHVPEEGDNLIVTQNEIMAHYISFIYKQGRWETGYYNPFTDAVTEKYNGKIKNVL